MKQLHFETTYEFAEFFKEKSPEMTQAIVHSIGDAITAGKKVAQMFEITMEGSDSVFEISLPKKEWITALENCLKHYQEWDMADDAIDTYLLIKQVKQWTN